MEITITKQLELDFRISEITIITGCFESVGRVGMEKESEIFVKNCNLDNYRRLYYPC